jgi:hypothetical protein
MNRNPQKSAACVYFGTRNQLTSPQQKLHGPLSSYALSLPTSLNRELSFALSARCYESHRPPRDPRPLEAYDSLLFFFSKAFNEVLVVFVALVGQLAVHKQRVVVLQNLCACVRERAPRTEVWKSQVAARAQRDVEVSRAGRELLVRFIVYLFGETSTFRVPRRVASLSRTSTSRVPNLVPRRVLPLM